MMKNQKKEEKRGSDKKKAQKESSALGKSKATNKFLGLIIFVFSFLLYSNTFHHHFVLDDFGIISENSMTQKGIKALPEIFETGYRATLNSSDKELYRPVSKAVFAVEWQIWNDNPTAFHVVNVLLFALSCCLIFYILLLLTGNNLISFIASIIFAAHPLHTEVVSNVKSADEILGFLFFLFTLLFVWKYIKANNILSLLAAAVFFLLSLLSKESSITFLAIVPLAIFFFSDSGKWKNIKITATLSAITIIFLFMRHAALKGNFSPVLENMNYLVGIQDFISQKATAVYLLGNYLKLHFFPSPLMSDGSMKQFPIVSIGDWRFILSFIVFLALLLYAIFNFRKKNILSFSILYFFISASVVSNIFILIGTNYGERLMYAPSFGFCLACALLLTKLVKYKGKYKSSPTFSLFTKENSKPLLVTCLIVVLFSFKTVARSGDWFNGLTLHSTDAVTASNSARAHYYLGNEYTIRLPLLNDTTKIDSYVENGVKELNAALSISSKYDEAYYSLGEIYSFLGENEKSLSSFSSAAKLKPDVAKYQNNSGDILFKMGKFDEAMAKFRIAVKLDSTYTHALCNLGTSYANLAINFLDKSNSAKQKADEAAMKEYLITSTAYFDSSIYFVSKSTMLDPTFSHAYYVLGIVYQNKGDKANADYYYSLSNDAKLKEERARLKKSRE